MASTQPNIVRVSWDFFVLFLIFLRLVSSPIGREQPLAVDGFETCTLTHRPRATSSYRWVWVRSLVSNLRPWEMNGLWGFRSGLALFKDKKCLSFVMKVNVKMSVRSSYHNCPECVVTVLSYPFSLTLFRFDSICWKLWPYRSRTFALSDVFIHLLRFWMRLLCLKFWFTSCARNLCVRDMKSL